MIKDEHPAAVKEATSTVLPQWVDALKTLLEMDPLADVADINNWDGLAIRIQSYKALMKFILVHSSF